MYAYLTLFAVSFLSATVLPGASEVTLAALCLRGFDPVTLWLVATVANTLGSVVNWILGRYLLRYQDAKWFPFKGERLARAEAWFTKRGVWSLTLGWVPVIGDGLTFVAGIFRVPLWQFIVLVGVGKALRYAVVISLLFWGTGASSQVDGTAPELLDPVVQESTVERIGALLEERYVFPEIAKTASGALVELSRSGAFTEATQPAAFAQSLTEALRKAAGDQHLLVRVRATPVESSEEDLARREAEQNFGFGRLSRMEGNIGYLELRSFTVGKGSIDVAAGAMAMLESCDALIFDLRQNEGGSPGMVQFLCSHFFNEPTHINSLYFREGDRTQEFWTHGVPGATLPDVPVFVLTSAKTFSAAEEFAYNLQALKRATIVGETTRGGAHPGGLFSVDERFEMVIPTGRAINPVTGTNWEGVGVIPDVPTSAETALDIALELARGEDR